MALPSSAASSESAISAGGAAPAECPQVAAPHKHFLRDLAGPLAVAGEVQREAEHRPVVGPVNR